MSENAPPIVFLLSPAHCGGRRAQVLLNPRADFPLALRLRAGDISLGEAFSFLSGLYFRGKLAYSERFARAAAGSGVHVITPGRGLVAPDQPLRHQDLVAMAQIPVSLDEPRYRLPLERDARRLGDDLGEEGIAVLLGSIATDKYVEILSAALGERLRFPGEFVGRGDMSRGGLLLRCVSESRELSYLPLAGAARHGPRPPRLQPIV